MGDENWLQLLGTCMGTRVAPTYANLFMGALESKMIENCPPHLRQFLHTWRQFMEFYNYLNSFNPTMKFDDPCHDSSNNSCDFLDVTITINNGSIETDLYRKTTAKPTALLPSSAYPNHIPSNIVFSMGFRLLRICSTEDKFELRLKELKEDFLIPRNYTPKIINSQFKRVRNLPGDTYKEKRKE